MSDQDPISDALSPGVLSIAVISPDDQRRKAALTELSECHSGPIREFTATYPALSEVSRVIGHNFDIVFVDLDSDLEYALELVETICSRDLAIAMELDAAQGSAAEAATALIARVRKLLPEVGIPATLGALGVTRDLIPLLARKAMEDACHQSNPRPCTETDMMSLYEKAL